LDRHVDELGRALGDELLEPTRIYARDCLTLVGVVDVHAFSHVTGGGLAANLGRVLPAGLTATVDRSTWAPAPVFGLVQRVGGVEQAEIERTLNMGVGMVAVVAAGDADRAVALLRERGVAAWVCGTVADGDAPVTLVGSHPAA
jgi:phosphoribosylformylglycinamidine cyclo-ligase